MLSSRCGRFHVLGKLNGEWSCVDCGLSFPFSGEGLVFGIVEVVTIGD